MNLMSKLHGQHTISDATITVKVKMWPVCEKHSLVASVLSAEAPFITRREWKLCPSWEVFLFHWLPSSCSLLSVSLWVLIHCTLNEHRPSSQFHLHHRSTWLLRLFLLRPPRHLFHLLLHPPPPPLHHPPLSLRLRIPIHMSVTAIIYPLMKRRVQWCGSQERKMDQLSFGELNESLVVNQQKSLHLPCIICPCILRHYMKNNIHLQRSHYKQPLSLKR